MSVARAGATESSGLAEKGKARKAKERQREATHTARQWSKEQWDKETEGAAGKAMDDGGQGWVLDSRRLGGAGEEQVPVMPKPAGHVGASPRHLPPVRTDRDAIT